MVFNIIDPAGAFSFDTYIKLFDYIETNDLWEYVEVNYFVKDKDQFISMLKNEIDMIEANQSREKKKSSLP